MTHPPPKSAALVATAALALTACGGSTEGTTSSDPASGGGDVALTWWHNSNTGAGKDYYDKVAADFEAANPGVTITLETFDPAIYGQMLQDALATGTAADIVHLPGAACALAAGGEAAAGEGVAFLGGRESRGPPGASRAPPRHPPRRGRREQRGARAWLSRRPTRPPTSAATRGDCTAPWRSMSLACWPFWR